MTWEDIQFATRMNKLEIENCLNQSIEFFDEKVFEYKEFIDDNEDGCSNNLKEAYGMCFEDSKNIHCGACGKGLEEAALNSELARTLEEVIDKGGHNYTGLVERKIKTVQDAFKKVDLKNMRLHATGLQTLAKLIENDINNVPIGFSYGRDADNTPLLNLINPNLLKIGRLHSRALDGPVRFPTGPKDLMVKVEQTYDAFFKIWNAIMVPKLIPQPKWFKDSRELKPGDIVYFQKN